MRQRSVPRLFVVVPVFNELENVTTLLEAFHDLAARFAEQYHLSFIVVDDGSTDGTARLFETLRADLRMVVLAHDTNRGPGCAFATGFQYLAGELLATDWVVTMEGDNTSRHELIATMMIRAREGYDVVLASPYLYGGGVVNLVPSRLLISHVANAFVKEFLGIHGILTVSSFFRLYRGTVLLTLQSHYGPRIVERAGFESMVELLLKMIYLHLSISEVPLVLDSSRRQGKSKMRILRTVAGYFMLWRHKRRWRQAAARPSAIHAKSLKMLDN